MIRATSEVDNRDERESFKAFEATKLIKRETLRVLGGSYKSWIENQVRLKAQLFKSMSAYIHLRSNGSQRSQRNIEILLRCNHDVAVLSIAPS